MKSIDLNCDLGEWKDESGHQKDAAIMPYITSCNIACGGHIGDQQSMLATIKLAKKNGVAVGAHPSYPDRVNFGRTVLEISEHELSSALKNQLINFKKLVIDTGAQLHHIKPHGALYNEAAKNEKVANTIIKVIKELEFNVPIYCQEGSVLARLLNENGLKAVFEVFADRAYEDDLSLRSRKLEGAIIHETDKVFEHIDHMVLNAKVKTHSGMVRSITAQTMCLHSDTEGSIKLAKQIFEYLRSRGVNIASV